MVKIKFFSFEKYNPKNKIEFEKLIEEGIIHPSNYWQQDRVLPYKETLTHIELRINQFLEDKQLINIKPIAEISGCFEDIETNMRYLVVYE